MSFINKSVNISQTNLLKSKFLSNYLQKINEHILTKKNIIPPKSYHIIPNNSNKYYLYITKKNNIEKTNTNYNILYFFPDDQTVDTFGDSKIKKNHVSDFFMEIDNKFNDEFILEGYIYTNDSFYNRYTFLLTDILFKNNNVIDFDYELRFCMLNELLITINNSLDLKNLNDHLTIGIHPVFTSDNENMIKIFMDNFVFNNQITSIEHIYDNFKKIRYNKNKNDKLQSNCIKLIEKAKYPDVYNVYNTETGDNEGILYIKGLKESKNVKSMFLKSSENKIKTTCKYNMEFNKWEICF
jgi:hypothetical protein